MFFGRCFIFVFIIIIVVVIVDTNKEGNVVLQRGDIALFSF